MPTRVATYALARRVPYLVERGTAWDLTAPIRYGSTGALVEPDSGTITITDPSGTELVTAAAVTVSSSTATYTWTSGAAVSLGEGYTALWTLVIGGVTYPVFRHPIIVCKYVPANTVSADDLYTDLPELEYRVPQQQGANGDAVGWQPQIDAAYYDLISRLLSDGRPVWKIVGGTGYDEWLRVKAKQRCIRAISHGPDSDWAQAAKEAAFELRAVENRMKVRYDDDDASVRRGGSPVYRLSPVGRSTW